MSLPNSDVELGHIRHVIRANEQEGSIDIKINRSEEILSLFTRKEDYERSLKGLSKISLTSYALDSVNLFLVFCALMWASAVLIGSYAQTLYLQDYYAVPILLFLQYLCIGLFAFHRTVGYRLHKRQRSGFLSNDWLLMMEIFIPLLMAGYAVQGYSIQRRDVALSNAPSPNAAAPPMVPDQNRQQKSLEFFYMLIILNAAVLVAKIIIKNLLHFYFLRSSSATSLLYYYDQMQFQGNNSWPQPWLDLEVAFKMQSFDYNYGSSAKEVCKMYTDLVWYLYGHEAGFEAAEAAMADTDSYVRQAAANMVGFWAVLEPLLEMQSGYVRLPLQFQIGLLSKLADVAAQSYGPTGRIAAARSIALLLEADPVGMATNVQLQSGEGLLVKRVNQLGSPTLQSFASAAFRFRRRRLLLRKLYYISCFGVGSLIGRFIARH